MQLDFSVALVFFRQIILCAQRLRRRIRFLRDCGGRFLRRACVWNGTLCFNDCSCFHRLVQKRDHRALNIGLNLHAITVAGFHKGHNRVGCSAGAHILLGIVFGGMYVLQYLAGYENITVFIILSTIAGLANSLRYVFMNFIAPDTIEYTRYKTGKDCAGIFYSLNAFVSKAVGGVGASIGLLVMGLFGWHEVQAESYDQLLQMGMQAGQAGYQTPEAIHGMWVVYALIPGIGFLLSTLVLFFYKLKDKDAELMAKCNAGEISREECEAQLSRKYS